MTVQRIVLAFCAAMLVLLVLAAMAAVDSGRSYGLVLALLAATILWVVALCLMRKATS